MGGKNCEYICTLKDKNIEIRLYKSFLREDICLYFGTNRINYLNRKEINFIFKIFYKKSKEVTKFGNKEQIKEAQYFLDSINFNKKENNEN